MYLWQLSLQKKRGSYEERQKKRGGYKVAWNKNIGKERSGSVREANELAGAKPGGGVISTHKSHTGAFHSKPWKHQIFYSLPFHFFNHAEIDGWLHSHFLSLTHSCILLQMSNHHIDLSRWRAFIFWVNDKVLGQELRCWLNLKEETWRQYMEDYTEKLRETKLEGS